MRFKLPAEADESDLVKIFIDICLNQADSHLDFDSKRFNKFYKIMESLTEHLREMPGDKRSILVPLLQHPNLEVRLRAAVNTLAVAPGAARATLEAIQRSGEQPQAGDAGMTIRALDEGIFKPT